MQALPHSYTGPGMVRAVLVVLALLMASGRAMAQQPFVIGEWAGNCAGDFRVGHRLEPDGTLLSCAVNKSIAAKLGMLTYRAESPGYFSLDFQDGGPVIVWRISSQTIRPWRSADGSIKD